MSGSTSPTSWPPPPRSATNLGVSNFLLRTQDVRNAAQLAHLASQQEAGQKLRFVLSPRFGFLFFVRGEAMHHFLLELLDSHAT